MAMQDNNLTAIRIAIPFSQITAFCQRWQIIELSLFGSALRPDFKDESDIDVLVVFFANVGWGLFDMLDMQDELQSIFGRHVDLVEKEALRNPFRRAAILNNRAIIYAA